MIIFQTPVSMTIYVGESVDGIADAFTKISSNVNRGLCHVCLLTWERGTPSAFATIEQHPKLYNTITHALKKEVLELPWSITEAARQT